jgi:hypothetical protein
MFLLENDNQLVAALALARKQKPGIKTLTEKSGTIVSYQIDRSKP